LCLTTQQPIEPNGLPDLYRLSLMQNLLFGIQ
jgi:hypothetical protein